MIEEPQDEMILKAINKITSKLSKMMLREFLKLPPELQMNLVMIKSSQLLLANILCHAANNSVELGKILDEQDGDMRELVLNCAHSGFADKFDQNKH